MAEGTQLRGPSFEPRWLRATGGSNLCTTSLNRPRKPCSLPRSFVCLKASSMLLNASGLFFSYVTLDPARYYCQ